MVTYFDGNDNLRHGLLTFHHSKSIQKLYNSPHLQAP